MDVAAKVDGKTDVGSCGKVDHSSACCGCGLNGPVDCRRVHCLAVALCSEVSNIEGQRGGARGGLGKCEGGRCGGCGCSGKTETAKSKEVASGRAEGIHKTKS